MTLIKYSGLVAANAGKLNGSIFQQGHSDNIMRNSIRPSNPGSPGQQNNRINWQFLVKRYSNLQPSQIAAWVDFAQQYTWINKVGDNYKPTGQMMYMRVNQNIFLAGGSLIDDRVYPTAKEQMSSFTVSQPNFVVNRFVLYFPNYTVPAGYVYLVYATIAMSPGIAYAKKMLKLIDIIPATTADAYDCTDNYIARFGSPVVGQKVFFKLRGIELASGFSGVDLFANCIVQPVIPIH